MPLHCVDIMPVSLHIPKNDESKALLPFQTTVHRPHVIIVVSIITSIRINMIRRSSSDMLLLAVRNGSVRKFIAGNIG